MPKWVSHDWALSQWQPLELRPTLDARLLRDGFGRGISGKAKSGPVPVEEGPGGGERQGPLLPICDGIDVKTRRRQLLFFEAGCM